MLLLFIIGLELKLSHLWSMKRDIFGLGLLQVVVTALCLGACASLIGFSPNASIVTGMALALSSTAIGLQMLDERNDLQAPYGQRSFAVLLFQDLSVVPILAILPRPCHRRGRAGKRLDGRPARSISATAIGGHRRRGADRPLRTEPVLSRARPQRRARGHDRVGAAGRARRGAPVAGSRPFDGDGRLPRRASAGGIEFPAPARSRYRAVSRHSARPVLHERRHVDRPVAAAAAMAGAAHRGPRGGRRASRSSSFSCRRFSVPSTRDAIRSGALLSPAGEFAFVLLPVALGLGLLRARPRHSW